MTRTQQEKEEEFSIELSDILSSVDKEDGIIVMGDFNGRVGSRTSPWESYISPHSDDTYGSIENVPSILELCAEQDLFITNICQLRRSPVQK